MYCFPEDHINTPHVARFHNHAEGEDTVGVSLWDIRATEDLIRRRGEAHEVVFEKLSDHRFSAEYYCGEYNSVFPRDQIKILSLGTYEY